MKEVKVFCRDETKIEEILKYLFRSDIPFEILGRQALLIPEEGYKKISSEDDGWFDIEKVDELPTECWRDARRTSSLFEKNIPDRFEPVDMPSQQVRSLET